MSCSSNGSGQQESLSESWIECGRMQSAAQTESSSVKMASVNSKALEKLLLDAQKESSCTSSRIDSLNSSRASPQNQHSPTGNQPNNAATEDVVTLQLVEARLPQEVAEEAEGVIITDTWVWDWSSRPEAVPPSSGSLQFKHPVTKSRSLSIRNTRIMRGIVFSLENLPVLIFTHACTFVLGAASMVFYLRRASRWSSTISAMMNS